MSVLLALLEGPGRFEHWPVESSRSKPCTQLATLRPFSITRSYCSCTLGFRPFQTAKGIPGGRTLESQCVLVQVMFGAAMTIQDDFFFSKLSDRFLPPPPPSMTPATDRKQPSLCPSAVSLGSVPRGPQGFILGNTQASLGNFHAISTSPGPPPPDSTPVPDLN